MASVLHGSARTADAPMGLRVPRSTVLTPDEEAIVVAFRQKTLLPLDDVPGCLRDTIPRLELKLAATLLSSHVKLPVPSKHPNSVSVKPAAAHSLESEALDSLSHSVPASYMLGEK